MAVTLDRDTHIKMYKSYCFETAVKQLTLGDPSMPTHEIIKKAREIADEMVKENTGITVCDL